jgi:hypothetical protein
MAKAGGRESLWQRGGAIAIPQRDDDGSPLKLQLPTVQVLAPDRWRIYLAARNRKNVGRTIFADVDPGAGMRVLDSGEAPSISAAGSDDFGANGVGPSCIFMTDDGPMMAVVGVRLRLPAYDAAIGFLRGQDGGRSFVRAPDLPPFRGLPGYSFAVTPDIQRIGATYHMWYSQGLGWREHVRPYPEPTYSIAHATSPDGTSWTPQEDLAIRFKEPDETGITRPCVRADGTAEARWEMWYCYRRKYDLQRPELRRYRIGYATSADLTRWQRRDEAHHFANPPLPGDFDDQMQCYPTVISAEGRSVMIYCGNDYGRGGIGFAERI